MKNKQPDQAGFTLLELVVTLAVGAILIFVVTQVITQLVVTNERARDLGVANTVVEEKMESLRSQGYVALADGTYDFSSELPVELLNPNSASYTISSFTPAIKKVDVQISFNDAGSSRTYNYSTLIGELGVGQ